MTAQTEARSPEPPLLVRVEDGVTWVTLNRPRALNALDESLLGALDRELETLDRQEPPPGAIVLTGAGKRAFCFGAELGELDGDDAGARRARFAELLPRFQSVIRQLSTISAPVVAAVNGFATGAGFDLALACDIRIASRKAKLGSVFVSLGLVPDGGGTFNLPRLVGLGRALELTMLGDAIDAERALAIGLVNQMVEPEELERAAADMAARLAAMPRPALLMARRLLREAAGQELIPDLDAALTAESGAQLECAGSESFAAALARRKRKAQK